MTKLGQNPQLKAVAIQLYVIYARTGQFPEDFTTNLRKHISSVSSRPHLGVWDGERSDFTGHDYAGLAAWVMRDRPEYFRELLLARKEGHTSWKQLNPSSTAPRYLVREEAALEQRALLTSLTNVERTRLRALNPECVPSKKSAGGTTGEPMKLDPTSNRLLNTLAQRYDVDPHVVAKQALTSVKFCLGKSPNDASPERKQLMITGSLVFTETESRVPDPQNSLASERGISSVCRFRLPKSLTCGLLGEAPSPYTHLPDPLVRMPERRQFSVTRQAVAPPYISNDN